MDYKNARIYQILNNVTNDVYVGSTCQPLSKRMAKHRLNMTCKDKQTLPLYLKMQEIGIEHFYIELLEECPCENKEQLRKREGQYIRQIGTLNKCIAGRSTKEYNYENKDKIVEQTKHYREANKERLRTATSAKATCECGSIHRKSDKAKHLRTKKHTDWVGLQSVSERAGV